MATDRNESIEAAARAYADSMGHGDACDLTLYGACDLTLYGEEYRCDCGYAALRSALAQPAAPHVKTEIVCLCGSTRFIDTFTEQYGRLTDEGKIVLSVGRVVPQSEQALGSARKVALDELHLRKIDLCDRVLVLNVGGYVGTSTRREIAYAKERGKPIDLLYPDAGLDGSAPAPSREAPEAGSAETMYFADGDAIKENDAGDVKHVLRVVGANADHSARIASWLAEQLNEGGRHGRASEVPVREDREARVHGDVQVRDDRASRGGEGAVLGGDAQRSADDGVRERGGDEAVRPGQDVLPRLHAERGLSDLILGPGGRVDPKGADRMTRKLLGALPLPAPEAVESAETEAGSTGGHESGPRRREALALSEEATGCASAPRAEGVERADRVVALEDSIRRWHHEKYGRAALIAPTVRKLGEEFGEFCEAAVKGDVPAMTEEAADVALILTNLVRAVGGGSLFDAMETKHEVCKQRLAAERGEG